MGVTTNIILMDSMLTIPASYMNDYIFHTQKVTIKSNISIT